MVVLWYYYGSSHGCYWTTVLTYFALTVSDWTELQWSQDSMAVNADKTRSAVLKFQKANKGTFYWFQLQSDDEICVVKTTTVALLAFLVVFTKRAWTGFSRISIQIIRSWRNGPGFKRVPFYPSRFRIRFACLTIRPYENGRIVWP